MYCNLLCFWQMLNGVFNIYVFGIYLYVCVYIYIYIDVSVCVCLYVCTNVYMYTCMDVTCMCLCVRLHLYMYVRMRVCTYACNTCKQVQYSKEWCMKKSWSLQSLHLQVTAYFTIYLAGCVPLSGVLAGSLCFCWKHKGWRWDHSEQVQYII